MNNIEKLIILFLAIAISNQVNGQVSSPFNTGISSDYLGWDIFTLEDLNIIAENANIQFITEADLAININDNGVALGNVTGNLPPLSVKVGSLDNPSWIGVRARTSPLVVSTTSIAYGGVFTVRANGQTNIAIDAKARGPLGNNRNVGIYANTCNDSRAYAVYGEASGSSMSWAGWFEGAVYRTGSWPTPSDLNLKSDIQELEGSLILLLSLSPKEYSFKVDEFATLNLPQGRHYGFLAQEVELTLPGLTRMAESMPKYNEDDEIINEPISFQSLNYLGFIPLIIDALQEQQQIIDSQMESINDLEVIIESLEQTLINSLFE